MHLLDAVQAPEHWRTVDFVSDLHLHASEPATFEAWRGYLSSTCCDALFILGDLFEVWVGDDVLDASTDIAAFPLACVKALAATTSRFPVYFMAGNRDFLVGEELLGRTGLQGLSDPTVLTLGVERWLLSHGDALCLDDIDYQRFRREVRTEAWRSGFLARPLSERLAVARQLRRNSDMHKATQTKWADVDKPAAAHLLAQHRAQHMVHGHTHQPATHPLGTQSTRMVLSDWDANSAPPRTEVLRWKANSGTAPCTAFRVSIKSASDA